MCSVCDLGLEVFGWASLQTLSPALCRNLIKKPRVVVGVLFMNPDILGSQDPGFLNQDPALSPKPTFPEVLGCRVKRAAENLG